MKEAKDKISRIRLRLGDFSGLLLPLLPQLPSIHCSRRNVVALRFGKSHSVGPGRPNEQVTPFEAARGDGVNRDICERRGRTRVAGCAAGREIYCP